MTRLFKSYKQFFFNIKTLLLFELVYKLITFAILAPTLTWLYEEALVRANMHYLSNSNIFSFLSRPTTLCILFLMVVISSLFHCIEINCIIYCYDLSYHQKHVRVFYLLRKGLLSSFRMLHPKNIRFFLLNLCMLPLSSITLISSYFFTLKIPDYVWNLIIENKLYVIIASVLLVLICIIAYSCCFCMHYFLLDRYSFKEAVSKSHQLLKNHVFSTFVFFIIHSFLIVFLLLAFMVPCTAIAMFTVKLFNTYYVALAIALSILHGVIQLFIFILSCFMLPITFSYFSACFYQYKLLAGEPIHPVYAPTRQTKNTFFQKRMLVVISLLAVVVISIYSFSGTYENLTESAQIWNSPSVCAHRGYSEEAPENTMPAFELAVKNMADSIEIDVQQTKDGTLIIMHDSNFKRTTGLDANVWEVDYEEIKDLDAGSWFSEEYEGVTIPTLEEVLEFAKEHRVQLNIDVKCTGHEVNFVPSIVETIENFNYESSCIITSFEYDLLKEIKLANSEIQTGYLMKAAFHGIADLDYVDAFSINYCFVTRELVDSIHKAGKEIYTWTVNDTNRMNAMVYADVDCIITDKPVLTQATIQAKGKNDYMIKLITYLMQE